jgi:dTDP-4-dehydrorhamnose 3,5-epimerase
MTFTPLKLSGAFLLEIEPIEDDRGFFARTFCRHEFERRALDPGVAQCNLSFNRRQGTLRGMHYQSPPNAEAKLVRCVRGAAYDVILDLRPTSPTYCRWVTVVLTPNDYRLLYIPHGIAHGFQTLQDQTELFYQMSEFYAPSCARGVRWNDPAFGIEWPYPDPILSEQDRSYPDFDPQQHALQTRLTEREEPL